MQVITETKTVYSFDELSEKAKEKALQEHASHNDGFYAEHVIDDAKSIAALMGWRIEQVYYSGFWSQGDGACFQGVLQYAKGCTKAVKAYAPKDAELYRIAQAWQDLQKRNFYAISANVRHSGHYYHNGCTVFDCQDSRNSSGYLENYEIEKGIMQIARDFMDWIYKQLENAYDYETSEESLKDLCEANDYTFLSCGTMYNIK